MFGPEEHERLRQTYESIALTKDERTTACDYNLRELEIETALGYLKMGIACWTWAADWGMRFVSTRLDGASRGMGSIMSRT